MDTTVRKTAKTLVWIAVSAAVTGVLTYISGHPELFNPKVIGAVGIVNMLLVAGKNYFDPNVKNL